MALGAAERERLAERARRVRVGILRAAWAGGSGHLGAALGQTDVLVAIYDALRIDPRRPEDPGRDRFVLSKGHGGLGHAALLAELGFFPAADLARFGESGHYLGMHLDHGRVPGVEVSTGSLGHGLGVALGIAVGARLLGAAYRTVCVVSDGELYEGSTWEALLAAPALRPRGLGVVIDRNRLTMDGVTEREVPLEPLAKKLEAFGLPTSTVDGHDLGAIAEALARGMSGDAPYVVVCETVKGKGVARLEGRPEWHYGALDSDAFAEALAGLGERP
jgi:transketolase